MDHGSCYRDESLLSEDGLHLTKVGKKCLCKGSRGPGEEGFKLCPVGERDVHSKPSSMKITVNGKTADLKGMAHMQGIINLRESSKTKSLRHSYEGLRCLYTNAQSMGNKQEELEVLIKERDCDLIGIRETW